MKVEESEKKYGKRWTEWTEVENIEHVQHLHILDLGVPLNMRLALEHYDFVPRDIKMTLRGNAHPIR